jgi:hypothetical protein
VQIKLKEKEMDKKFEHLETPSEDHKEFEETNKLGPDMSYFFMKYNHKTTEVDFIIKAGDAVLYEVIVKIIQEFPKIGYKLMEDVMSAVMLNTSKEMNKPKSKGH